MQCLVFMYMVSSISTALAQVQIVSSVSGPSVHNERLNGSFGACARHAIYRQTGAIIAHDFLQRNRVQKQSRVTIARGFVCVTGTGSTYPILQVCDVPVQSVHDQKIQNRNSSMQKHTEMYLSNNASKVFRYVTVSNTQISTDVV